MGHHPATATRPATQCPDLLLRSGPSPADTPGVEPLPPLDRLSSGDGADPGADPDRLERTGRRWLIWSFVFCPCHLPWTIAVLAAVFGGTALGGAIRANALVVGVVSTTLYAIGVGIGFRYIRRATAGRSCSGGSCTLPAG